MPKKTKERRVVVTGLGPLCAIGFGKDALWKSVQRTETGLKKHDYFIEGELWDSFWVHKIENFSIKKFDIEKTILDEITNWKEGKEDRDLLYSLAAVKLAIDDSGIIYDKENNNFSLFLTIEHPGFEPFCEQLMKEAILYLTRYSVLNDKNFKKTTIFRYLFDKLVASGYDLQSFMYLYLVSKAFGIHGYSLFTSNACASGLFALEAAYKQIKYGGSDAVIVVGGDDTCTMFKHMWFKERNLYAEDGKIKPFSKKADGIVFGDGYSAIILEDLEHARKREAHIYAEYLGGGFSLEGWKVVFPSPGSNSYKKAISEALDNSGVSAKEVDLINPHGVGIRITDAYEAKAIISVFGASQKPLVTAFKPLVGHNLGGSALIETIILLLAMENNFIPATLNCEDFDEKHKINLVQKPLHQALKTVIKLSCGFAGYNGAVIFKKYA